MNLAEAEGPRSRLKEIRKSSQERVLRGVLTIYIWKMTDAVGLTEEQAAQVLQRMEEKGLDAFLFGPPAGFDPTEGRFERQPE